MSDGRLRVTVAGMVGKKVALTSSPRYRDFIRSRDNALEDILAKYTRAANLMVETVKKQCLMVAADIHVQPLSSAYAKKNAELFARRVHPWFEIASHRTATLVDGLRRTVYFLSYIGQAEAIGRATGQKTKIHIHKQGVQRIRSKDSTGGGTIAQRIELAYARLMADVVDALHSSLVMESNVTETRERIERAFPKSRKVKYPTVMAPMKESDQSRFNQDGISFSSGVMDDDEWEHAMSDYEARYLPGNRSPDDKVLYGPVDDDDSLQVYTRYEWEVEQELTQDFVQRVRDGDDDAARANGITDFQWIALGHETLCESCEWRDGLTITEIEAELDGGHSDDRLDGTAPALHPNCYCRLAPMSDSIPEESPPDFGGFDEWLAEKAKEAA